MSPEEYTQLKRDHDALQAEMQEFRTFYGTDRLRDLGAQFDDLKKTTRLTAYFQLSIAALTPLLTAFIAYATYQATNHNEQEKARVERTKLAADLYSKALAEGSPSVLLNTANLTSTLLAQDPTFAQALTSVLTTLAQRQSEVRPALLSSATPSVADTAARRQQQQRIRQLTQNVALPKRTVGVVAQKLARDASRTLSRSRRQADSLALAGYQALAAGQAANAQNYFAKADLAYPGLGNSYELSRYLHTYRANNHPTATEPLRNLQPAQQREVASTVLKKFTFGLPDNIRQRLAAQAAAPPEEAQSAKIQAVQ